VCAFSPCCPSDLRLCLVGRFHSQRELSCPAAQLGAQLLAERRQGVYPPGDPPSAGPRTAVCMHSSLPK
jgi:hypothetical protein